VAKVPNGIETLPKISSPSRAHESYRQKTDRRTTTYSEYVCYIAEMASKF